MRVSEALKEFEIPKEKVLSLVSDSGSNMVAMAKHLSLPWSGCASHRVHTAAELTSRIIAPVADALKSSKDVLAFFMRSNTGMRDLLKAQRQFDAKPLRLIGSSETTRWNSTYDSLLRLMEFGFAIADVIKDPNSDVPEVSLPHLRLVSHFLRLLSICKSAITKFNDLGGGAETSADTLRLSVTTVFAALQLCYHCIEEWFESMSCKISERPMVTVDLSAGLTASNVLGLVSLLAVSLVQCLRRYLLKPFTDPKEGHPSAPPFFLAALNFAGTRSSWTDLLEHVPPFLQIPNYPKPNNFQATFLDAIRIIRNDPGNEADAVPWILPEEMEDEEETLPNLYDRFDLSVLVTTSVKLELATLEDVKKLDSQKHAAMEESLELLFSLGLAQRKPDLRSPETAEASSTLDYLSSFEKDGVAKSMPGDDSKDFHSPTLLARIASTRTARDWSDVECHSSEEHQLKALCKVLLTMPSGSVFIERCFSSATFINDPLRTRLSHERFCQENLVRANFNNLDYKRWSSIMGWEFSDASDYERFCLDFFLKNPQWRPSDASTPTSSTPALTPSSFWANSNLNFSVSPSTPALPARGQLEPSSPSPPTPNDTPSTPFLPRSLSGSSSSSLASSQPRESTGLFMRQLTSASNDTDWERLEPVPTVRHDLEAGVLGQMAARSRASFYRLLPSDSALSESRRRQLEFLLDNSRDVAAFPDAIRQMPTLWPPGEHSPLQKMASLLLHSNLFNIFLEAWIALVRSSETKYAVKLADLILIEILAGNTAFAIATAQLELPTQTSRLRLLMEELFAVMTELKPSWRTSRHHDRDIDSVAAEMRMKVTTIPVDCNCFYNSLLMCMEAHLRIHPRKPNETIWPTDASSLRTQLVEHGAVNFNSLVSDHKLSLKKWKSTQAKRNSWANTSLIPVACDWLRLGIVVWRSDGAPSVFEPNGGMSGSSVLMLYNKSGSKFQAIIPTDLPTKQVHNPTGTTSSRLSAS